MSYVLATAALTSIAWGLTSIADPALAFRWSNMPQPSYPEFLQCIGMIWVVFGVGFAAAAFDPPRHWPIVLAGFLVKVGGPIGFAWSAARGRLPWRYGWTMLATDLIWSVPFGLILLVVYRSHAAAKRTCCPDIQRMALRARTQYGLTLLQMSTQSPVMLVFLRHAGCTFCREALSDIAARQGAIQATGTLVVLVHMGDAEASVIRNYGLEGLPRVSDPHRHLYRAFGLRRGNIFGVFGPKVWWRGLIAGLINGHGIAPPIADMMQMPGVFVIFHGEILQGYRHRTVADRPNYLELAALG
jgi:peroxiredoxin